MTVNVSFTTAEILMLTSPPPGPGFAPDETGWSDSDKATAASIIAKLTTARRQATA